MRRPSKHFCDNRALNYHNNSYFVGKRDFRRGRKLVSILITRALFIIDDAPAPMHAHGTKVETFLLWATSLRAGRSFLPSQQRVHISNNNRHIKLSKLRTPCRYVVGYIHRMVIGWPESVLVHVEVRFLDISSLKYFEKVDELIFVNK